MDEPMACSLDDEALAARRADWRSLARDALLRSNASPGRVEMTYRWEEDVEGAVRRLIQAERECCPFLDFALRRDGDLLHLSVTSPPETPIPDGPRPAQTER